MATRQASAQMFPPLTLGVAWAAMTKNIIPTPLLADTESMRSVAEACLSADHPVKLNEFERQLLWEASQDIQPSLEKVADALRGDNEALDALQTLIECARRIGAMTILTECQQVAWRQSQARSARAGRASSPAEMALMEAITSEHKSNTSARPYKDADAIQMAVNRRLKEQGYEPVKLDVIRRRLEKLPRS